MSERRLQQIARTSGRATVLLLAFTLVAATRADVSGPASFRTIDGSSNSTMDPKMGAAGMPLIRITPHAYADFISAPAGTDRPSARQVSNEIAAERFVALNAKGATDYLWLWGQFVDHDLGLTPTASPAEPMDIAVPAGDPWFDPAGTGAMVIAFERSAYDTASGVGPNNPRRQVNIITAWIDGSNVYGSDAERSMALRRLDGTGRLRTSRRQLLPRNTLGLENAGGPSPELFVAGDERANEQVALTAMHTLWVREHNRMAKLIRRQSPAMDGDEIYELSRAWVGALMQRITYREFLPVLLGPGALPDYSGWQPSVDGSIANEFSTAAYRFGHTMVSSQLLRLKRNGRSLPGGPLTLRDAFFNPEQVARDGIDPYLRGLAAQQARAIDNMIVDDLRNFLFGPPGAGGFDLASLNIQRGRDHGLDDFNSTRSAYGLAPYRDFYQLTGDAEVAGRLESLYGDVRDIDLWVGGLAERKTPGSLLGETFHAIVADQFRRLRDGDRFFYRRMYSGARLQEIENTTLADVIRRNTRIRRELPEDVFRGY